MESLDHIDAEEPLIGPTLPKAKESEFFEENAENQLEYEVVNGIPCYKEGHVIGGHVQIFERIGYDDRIGGTFLGLSADGKELVVRVAPADSGAHVVHAEAGFLCKVEAEKQDWRHFSQVHKLFATDTGYHVTLYFRGGPGLDQCFAMRNKFSFGTAGRLASDVLAIIRCAHKHGYFLRNVNMDCFHYDASSRHLFQADISSILKTPSPSESEDLLHIAVYSGHLDYAPLAHHAGQKVGPRHDLESWFYQLLHMVWGELPWGALAYDEVEAVKKALRGVDKFKELPEQFQKLASIVFSSSPSISPSEYSTLSELAEQIYTQLGGITDYEENMDFEREPTPEEIPRFVLCRDDEEGPKEEGSEEESKDQPKE